MTLNSHMAAFAPALGDVGIAVSKPPTMERVPPAFGRCIQWLTGGGVGVRGAVRSNHAGCSLQRRWDKADVGQPRLRSRKSLIPFLG